MSTEHIGVKYESCGHFRFLVRHDTSTSDLCGCECPSCLPVRYIVVPDRCPGCHFREGSAIFSLGMNEVI